MSEFKVGDKVKIKPYGEVADHYCIDKTTWEKYEDKEFTIRTIYPDRNRCIFTLNEDEISLNWPDYAFEKVSDRPIYASDLMTEARKNHEKYEGKRYKVIGGSPLMVESDTFNECFIDNGRLRVNGTIPMPCTIYCDTQLEEIKPEPKPVSFMEAVNSGKKIKQKSWSNFYSLYEVINHILEGVNEDSLINIINGEWHIEP